MSRTVTTSTKDTRAALATLDRVSATPTEAQVLSAVTASDKATGVLALTVARYADNAGKTHTQISAALSKAGATRSPGSIQNDIRAGRILARMIEGGHTPTLDDVRAAVAIGNASEDEAKAISAKVPAFATATGSTLAKALAPAKAERSSIRSAKAKKASEDRVRLENTSGTPAKAKAPAAEVTPVVAISSTVSANDRVALAVAALAKIDSPLGIDPSEFDRLTEQVARVGAMLASLAAVPVTKATKKADPAPAQA